MPNSRAPGPGTMLVPASIVGVAVAGGAAYLAVSDPRFPWVVVVPFGRF